jgi:hypothetical protein
MTLQTRPATADETIACAQSNTSYRTGKVSFRHFVREQSLRTAKHGVRHVSRSQGKFSVIGGAPHITTRGDAQPITCTAFIFEDGKVIFADLRIDSPYLR